MSRALYEFELAGWPRKLAFAAACLALTTIYSLCAIQVLRAYWASESLSPEGLKRATLLEPANAAHWSRLGRYKFFVEQDVPASIPAYETAAKLNPHSARYWLDLASAYAVMGQSGQQQDALQRALAADPRSPRVAWEAGNFYLIRGDAAAALKNLRVVVEGDARMRPEALTIAWRSFQNAPLLLEKLLPADAAAHWDLLRVIVQYGDLQAANAVWDSILSLKQPFPAKEALAWVDALLRSGKAARAQSVWRDLAKFDPGFFSYVPQPDNLIVNGGFEDELLNAGFDWRQDRSDGVEVSVDRNVFHFGTRSLRLEFPGRVTSKSGIRQIVAVKPETSYELSGFLKAEHLQTAVGASLVARDAASGMVLARSAPIDSSTGWLKRAVTFKTSPATELIEVGIGRAYDTNTLIKGTLWIDDVALTSPALVSAGSL
jgi:tetratricopeptide (TPR) repeat protein